MTTSLRILLIVISFFTMISIVSRTRKSKLKISYAMFWIVFSTVLMLISIFPSIIYFFSSLIGIQSPANLVYLIVIFILIIDNFYITIKLSHTEDMIQNLTEELAIRKAIETDKKHDNEKLR